MGENQSGSMAGRSRRRIDFAIVGALGLLLALVYLPVVLWLGHVTFQMEQLHNGGLIVLITLFIGLQRAVRQQDREREPSNVGFVLILAGLGVLLLLKIAPVFTLFLVLLSFCLSFAGMTALILGPRGALSLAPAIAGIHLMGLFAGIAPSIDWPLRALAAKWSANLLAAVGADVRVAMNIGQAPRLLLAVDGRLFVVASECNGFGLLFSCLLVAALLIFYHRLSWVEGLVILALAAPTALLFNSLRIVGISMAAGAVPLPYAVIHETIGILSYLAALGLLWGIARWCTPPASDSG
ncbi:MAG: exosortase/archaeosortase family protein [Pirellulaceae bacterium]